MGSLVRRLRRLDAERKREDAEWERQEAELSRDALRYLSDEDLYALEDVLETGQEDGSATFEDLYRLSSEQSLLEGVFPPLPSLNDASYGNSVSRTSYYKLAYPSLGEARHPVGGEVPARGGGQRHRQRREHDSKLPVSMARPNTNDAPHLRARAWRTLRLPYHFPPPRVPGLTLTPRQLRGVRKLWRKAR